MLFSCKYIVYCSGFQVVQVWESGWEGGSGGWDGLWLDDVH